MNGSDGNEYVKNARTEKRHDFKIKHSVVSNIVCALLALFTTFLIWLSGAV